MDNQTLVPHVIIFPFKSQGHVNSMLKLAELLCLENLHVTFLVSQNTQNRLLNYSDAESRFKNYPLFKFEAFPDEVCEENPCTDDALMMLFDSLKEIAKPFLKELLVEHKREGSIRPPVTCIIADGIMGFAIDVAKEMGVPIIYFRTVSACAFWAYFSIPQLIEAEELPFKAVMEVKKEEFQERASKMAKLGRDCVNEGGSSCQNLKRLVQDIRSKAPSLSIM